MTPATHHMRILMLGNSLTTAHDLPHILEAEFDAEVRVHARGGARLAEHLNPKTKLGANTTTALRDESWDVVVLQEMSHGAATSPHAYLRSVTALCDAILAQHATPLIYGTWSYAPSCPRLRSLGLSSDELHEALQNSFEKAAAITHAPLANAGSVYKEHMFASELYASDGIHPSRVGTRLIADTISHAILALS